MESRLNTGNKLNISRTTICSGINLLWFCIYYPEAIKTEKIA